MLKVGIYVELAHDSLRSYYNYSLSLLDNSNFILLRNKTYGYGNILIKEIKLETTLILSKYITIQVLH